MGAVFVFLLYMVVTCRPLRLHTASHKRRMLKNGQSPTALLIFDTNTFGLKNILCPFLSLQVAITSAQRVAHVALFFTRKNLPVENETSTYFCHLVESESSSIWQREKFGGTTQATATRPRRTTMIHEIYRPKRAA